MELVERQDLLEALRVAAAEARAGTGRVVLVGGEAGVGKTTLLRAFVDAVGGDRRVLWGSCEPLATPEPLGAFHDMRPIRPVIEAHPRRVELLDALFDVLAGPPPTLMVIDDVHWADEATLDALRFLGRRIHATSGLLVAAYREDEAGSTALREVLGDLATAPGARRLHVRPLSEAGVATLAAGKAVDPGRLHATTGGNPFYVTEVLAAPGWTVPPTVGDAVLARVARLGGEARAVLEVVSLSPGGLEPGLAAELSSQDAASLDACIEQGMLVLANDRLSFRHELARLAVERSIPDSRRRRLHEQLLARLEVLRGIDAARLAHHADAAGDTAATVRHAFVAAEEASARGAHRAAAEHLARAVGASGSAAPGVQAELVAAWADERQRFDSPRDVLVVRERALGLRRRAGDRLGEARELLEMSRLMEPLGDDDAGVRRLDEAMAILEGLPESPLLARALASSAYLAYMHMRFDQALAQAASAAALADETGGSEASTLALRVRGTILNILGTGVEGMDAYRELRALAIAFGDREGEMVALIDPATDLTLLRRYEEARRLCEEAIAIGRSADLDARVVFVESNLAAIELEQGRWSEAERILDRLEVDTERHALLASEILAIRGCIAVRRGTPGGSEQLAAAWRIVRHGPPATRWRVVAGRAEAAWLGGRPEQIPDIVGTLFVETRDAGLRWPAGELGFWLWRADALPDPPMGVAEPYALRMAGEWRAAAEAWERIGCPYEQADALAEGDEPAMREALGILTRLGAGLAGDRLRDRMRRAGVARIPARARASTRSAPAQLTRRQLEILGLLAGGLTDRDIARRLFITEKTAGHHVSAVLAKLGVGSRVEAGVVARKMGIVAAET